MRHFAFILLILYDFVSYKTNALKPRSVNLALETIFEFKNDDRSQDVHEIEKMQNFLERIKKTLKHTINTRRKFNDEKKFTDIIEEVIEEILNCDDDDLLELCIVLVAEMKEQRNRNSNSRIINKGLRRYMDYKPDIQHDVNDKAEAIRIILGKVLLSIQKSSKSEDQIALIEFLNSLYDKETMEKLKKTLHQLKMYNNASNKKGLDLTKIVKNGVRAVFFDHYSDMSERSKINLKDKIAKFWIDWNNKKISTKMQTLGNYNSRRESKTEFISKTDNQGNSQYDSAEARTTQKQKRFQIRSNDKPNKFQNTDEFISDTYRVTSQKSKRLKKTSSASVEEETLSKPYHHRNSDSVIKSIRNTRNTTLDNSYSSEDVSHTMEIKRLHKRRKPLLRRDKKRKIYQSYQNIKYGKRPRKRRNQNQYKKLIATSFESSVAETSIKENIASSQTISDEGLSIESFEQSLVSRRNSPNSDIKENKINSSDYTNNDDIGVIAGEDLLMNDIANDSPSTIEIKEVFDETDLEDTLDAKKFKLWDDMFSVTKPDKAEVIMSTMITEQNVTDEETADSLKKHESNENTKKKIVDSNENNVVTTENSSTWAPNNTDIKIKDFSFAETIYIDSTGKKLPNFKFRDKEQISIDSISNEINEMMMKSGVPRLQVRKDYQETLNRDFGEYHDFAMRSPISNFNESDIFRNYNNYRNSDKNNGEFKETRDSNSTLSGERDNTKQGNRGIVNRNFGEFNEFAMRSTTSNFNESAIFRSYSNDGNSDKNNSEFKEKLDSNLTISGEIDNTQQGNREIVSRDNNELYDFWMRSPISNFHESAIFRSYNGQNNTSKSNSMNMEKHKQNENSINDFLLGLKNSQEIFGTYENNSNNLTTFTPKLTDTNKFKEFLKSQSNDDDKWNGNNIIFKQKPKLSMNNLENFHQNSIAPKKPALRNNDIGKSIHKKINKSLSYFENFHKKNKTSLSTSNGTHGKPKLKISNIIISNKVTLKKIVKKTIATKLVSRRTLNTTTKFKRIINKTESFTKNIKIPPILSNRSQTSTTTPKFKFKQNKKKSEFKATEISKLVTNATTIKKLQNMTTTNVTDKATSHLEKSLRVKRQNVTLKPKNNTKIVRKKKMIKIQRSNKAKRIASNLIKSTTKKRVIKTTVQENAKELENELKDIIDVESIQRPTKRTKPTQNPLILIQRIFRRTDSPDLPGREKILKIQERILNEVKNVISPTTTTIATNIHDDILRLDDAIQLT